MWLHHFFPGMTIQIPDLYEMTPEELAAVRKAGEKVLVDDQAERLEHTKIIARAAGMRIG